MTAIQRELTLGKELELVNVLADLEIDRAEDLMGLTLRDFLRVLVKQRLLVRAMAAVLEGDFTEEDLLAMPHDVVEAVIRDFFAFNSKFIESLQGLLTGSVFASLEAAAATSSLPPNA